MLVSIKSSGEKKERKKNDIAPVISILKDEERSIHTFFSAKFILCFFFFFPIFSPFHACFSAKRLLVRQ